MENALKKIQLLNGETYSYREFGNASKTLVFLHSAYFSSAFMSPYLGQLSETFHIYAPDFRGHGHSTYNKPISQMEDLVEDVKEFVDMLGLTKFYLVGWSLGGATSLKFAATYPDYVEKLVVLGSAGAKGIPSFKDDEQGNPTTERAVNDEEVLQTKFGKILVQVRGANDRGTVGYLLGLLVLNGRTKPSAETLDRYVDDFFLCRCHEQTLMLVNKFNISNENNGVIDGTNELSKIKAKVLIIHGEKDSIVPFKDAEDLKRRFQDQAELKSYEEGGHATLTDYPEQIIPVIKEFCS